ncbi:hypothetical protein C5167_014470 [Papaver somniferum]|uniref:non-specific serine/threonine protein kinase n=1 Tax=Papaver somniferum TaxID=3469 RepID=A0A4Y7J6E4_PAPSO|nr:receptor-like cytosolic serine/threonine-protein kinase RBK1 isoform X1 [Papaver somniferum]RZC55622.1 hypothetical protein C5167_014470 [Papaver somniferum]
MGTSQAESREIQGNPEIDCENDMKKPKLTDDHQSSLMGLIDMEIQTNITRETHEKPVITSEGSIINPENPAIDSEENGETKENSETESTEELKKPELNEEYNCSPRGVLEIPTSDTDNSTSSNNSNNSGSNKHLIPPELSNGLQWKSFIRNIKKKSARRFSTLPLLITSSELTRRHLNRKLSRIRCDEDDIQLVLPDVMKPSWKNFSQAELSLATDNFTPENLLGKGGHAEVYKGCLPDGTLVAVKRLMKKEKEGKEEEVRTGDFLTELGIIAHVNHPNAARLIGFGVEGGLHLVLQYSPHGSLTSLLHGSEKTLDWKIRYKVAVGVAEGLNYLHQGCHRRIIHRDIKASNILLTQDYEPQISDFGLAKWLPEQWTHHIVYPIEGTFGYLAPEYFMHGIVDEKTDVFAFGVLLLELITGRRAVDSSRQSLVIWAKPLLESKNIKELVDPRLGEDYMLGEMKQVMLAASSCIHHLSAMRPVMSRVVEILKGEEKGTGEMIAALLEHQKSFGGRGVIFDACDSDDYTCSTYLNDLDRHKQLVLLE